MELENVLKEKVPYHARVYPFYLPVMGTNFKTGEEVLYNEDLQKEIDDLSEDEDTNYGNDGRNQHRYENVPIAKIKRAHKINGEEKEFEILEKFPVDNCKVKYSLLSNATRVKFEIRAYNYDGSPARNVDGHIRAYFGFRGSYEKYLFGGHNKCEKSDHIAASDTLKLCPSVLILPRDLCPVSLDISLENNAGDFMVKKETVVILRTIAVDEPHYILGEKGYILLTAIWACLCVDLGQGVCTCPGTAMGTFQAGKGSGGDMEDHQTSLPIITSCSEDGNEGSTKRAKIRQIRQVRSTTEETTSNEDSE